MKILSKREVLSVNNHSRYQKVKLIN